MLNLTLGHIVDSQSPTGVSVLTCGDCNNYAHQHPIDTPFVTCDNTTFNRDGYDYHVHDRNSISLVESYSGNPANIIELTDGVANLHRFSDEDFDSDDYSYTRVEDSILSYDNGSGEADAIERWADQDPKVCTHAINCWSTKVHERNCTLPGCEHFVTTHTYGDYANLPKGTVDSNGHYLPNNFVESYDSTNQDRNVFIEATEGFIARKFLDEELTKKYHARLLNMYIDKQGRMAIGGVRISVLNGSVTATCVNPDCRIKDLRGNYVQATYSVSLNSDRSEQEDFILEVIRHGNNHSASWFRNRETFYEINEFTKSPTALNDVELSDVDFLFEHQRYCNDAKCSCTQWLESLVPALAVDKEAI